MFGQLSMDTGRPWKYSQANLLLLQFHYKAQLASHLKQHAASILNYDQMLATYKEVNSILQILDKALDEDLNINKDYRGLSARIAALDKSIIPDISCQAMQAVLDNCRRDPELKKIISLCEQQLDKKYTPYHESYKLWLIPNGSAKKRVAELIIEIAAEHPTLSHASLYPLLQEKLQTESHEHYLEAIESAGWFSGGIHSQMKTMLLGLPHSTRDDTLAP